MTDEITGDSQHPPADDSELTHFQSVGGTAWDETKDLDSHKHLPDIKGYELKEVLGRGGMGIVFRATDQKLKREVAIKMVLVGPFANTDLLARFRSEAETVARLRHPNIVQIFDVGEHRGQPYLVFERIQGPSLARYVSGKPQTPQFAAEMTDIVARAVHYGHVKSVVHRDLKPSNILLETVERSASGNEEVMLGSSITKSNVRGSSRSTARTTTAGLLPKVSDFGLAKQLDVDAQQTTTGHVLGTARYMAPEQALGKKVGPAADIYSLGIILYELLVGRTPFLGATAAETIHMQTHDEPVSVRRLQPRLPRDIETICMKCLEKEPSKRYSTAESLADDLSRFLRNEPIAARPVGWLERGIKWTRRRPAVATLVGALIVVTTLAFAGVTWQWQKTMAAQRQGAEVQVDLLLHARPEAVPTVVSNLTPYRRWVDPALASILERSELATHERDRVCIGLLPVNPNLVPYLSDRLIATEPPLELAEFLIVRDALIPYRDQIAQRHWDVLINDKLPAAARLRAAVALARFDPPQQESTDDRWSTVAPFIATHLATHSNMNPDEHAMLMDSLSPLRSLLVPSLVTQLRSGKLSDSKLSTVTSMVVRFAQDDPQMLVDLAVNSDRDRYGMIQSKLNAHPLAAVGLLRDVLDQEAKVGATEFEKDALARRQAIAAVTLAHLGRHDLLWNAMRFDPQPRLRTYLIHLLADYGFPGETLAAQVKQEADVSARRAILLSLGEYNVDELDKQVVSELIVELTEAFHEDPDCGVHSAIQWILARWQQSERLQETEVNTTPLPTDGRKWIHHPEGHVLSVIDGPVTFRMGSPQDEPGRRGEEQHDRLLGQSYAIATQEVSLEQFQRFIEAYPQLKHSQEVKYGPDASGPAIGVSWMQAVMYCRWLSDLEHLDEDEMCYPPIEQLMETNPLEIRIPDDVMNRIGYRLPTEGEWEFACRSGSETARSYGFAPELMDHYGWHIRNSSDRVWPCGMLKPNEWGLFDMYGNVWEWCLNWRKQYSKGVDGFPYDDSLHASDPPRKYIERIIRGGSITNRIEVLRSAQRDWYAPGPGRNHNVGFRIAKTIRDTD